MKLVNHFAVCLDRSGSMEPIQKQAVDTFNQNVKSIREGAAASGQESTVTFVTFGGDVETIFAGAPVETLKTFDYREYKPGGGTPLFDAVGRTIAKLKERHDAASENVSFMFIVITDGEENSSSLRAFELLSRMGEVQKTDRWSFAFLLPKGMKSAFCSRFNIPEGNVKEWDATVKGMTEAAHSVDLGITSYYTSRSQGMRSTKGFFTTDLKGVTAADVKARGLVDIRDRVRVFDVNRSVQIREYVEGELGIYSQGHAYYQLMKDELVQHHKQVMLRERGSYPAPVYAGADARKLLGLPDGLDIKVRPGDHANWDIFVQSTSVNRKLVPGTKLLYLV